MIFEAFVVGASLGLVFDQATIAGLGRAVDGLRNADLGFDPARQVDTKGEGKMVAAEYGADCNAIMPKLRPRYAAPAEHGNAPLTVFFSGFRLRWGVYAAQSPRARSKLKRSPAWSLGRA